MRGGCTAYWKAREDVTSIDENPSWTVIFMAEISWSMSEMSTTCGTLHLNSKVLHTLSEVNAIDDGTKMHGRDTCSCNGRLGLKITTGNTYDTLATFGKLFTLTLIEVPPK